MYIKGCRAEQYGVDDELALELDRKGGSPDVDGSVVQSPLLGELGNDEEMEAEWMRFASTPGIKIAAVTSIGMALRGWIGEDLEGEGEGLGLVDGKACSR